MPPDGRRTARIGSAGPRRSILLLVAALAGGLGAWADDARRVPILVYHRFGPVVSDTMTVTTTGFEAQLRYLADTGHAIVPLRVVVDHRRGLGPAPPPDAVVITADDGHRSVYTEMLPIVRRHHIPVTLFVYPSAISHADYALTWDQLRALQATGLFDVQSHTYWHPNFQREKAHLSPREYTALVDMQLRRSRATIEAALGRPVDMLAWPFGLTDAELIARARAAGYVAGLILAGRDATPDDDVMALPRHLIAGSGGAQTLARLLGQHVR